MSRDIAIRLGLYYIILYYIILDYIIFSGNKRGGIIHSPENHCLLSLRNALWKLKSPRGWALLSGLSFWEPAEGWYYSDSARSNAWPYYQISKSAQRLAETTRELWPTQIRHDQRTIKILDLRSRVHTIILYYTTLSYTILHYTTLHLIRMIVYIHLQSLDQEDRQSCVIYIYI